MKTVYALVIRLAVIAVIAIGALVVSYSFDSINDLTVNLLGFKTAISAVHIKVTCIVLVYFSLIVVFFIVCDFAITCSLERKQRLHEAQFQASRKALRY